MPSFASITTLTPPVAPTVQADPQAGQRAHTSPMTRLAEEGGVGAASRSPTLLSDFEHEPPVGATNVYRGARRARRRVKQDRSILAAILCGSLSHDTVWERSDIDLVLVTIDDSKVAADTRSLYADGINAHAFLLPREAFRRTIDGTVQNSFMHALLAKGRLLYAHDETVARLCESLRVLGDRDKEVQLLRAACGALPSLYKAHKWLVTRGDLDYTALWILYTAASIAQIEVISAGMVADREVIPRAAALNPPLFEIIYTGLLNTPKTRALIAAALDTVDRLSRRSRRDALRARRRVPPRRGRRALVPRHRSSLRHALRRRERDDGV